MSFSRFVFTESKFRCLDLNHPCHHYHHSPPGGPIIDFMFRLEATRSISTESESTGNDISIRFTVICYFKIIIIQGDFFSLVKKHPVCVT